MRVELKPFQENAARQVLDALEAARESIARGKLEAVVLSAPTGSGKTITVASVIDQTFSGGDGVIARPASIFLWLSDSPELNSQSKAKLLSACDNLPFHKMVTIESDTFDEPRLANGYLYFINTQLLGKDKRLTQEGDKRQYTFWQTLENTIRIAPEDFILIIDEAHRGATATDRNRTTIMQKFILGSPSEGLSPVPLVLGMSATPQRFTALLGSTNRIHRPIIILPDEVTSSGLLKDMIIVHNPRNKAPADLTMLEEAAKKWKSFSALWEAYCRKAGEKEVVRPILVVQVEDGTEKIRTRTPLEDAIRAIEKHTGTLALNEIVHCFQEASDIQVGGHIIRKIEASRIQESPDVKVVFFKTALSTGWDCPRAETMMSFRRAKDPTSIAQLVGRMIRTPLARRIGTDEVLDTVELYLPHYDSSALDSILDRLRNPDAEEGIAARVETVTEEYSRDPAMAQVFAFLDGLPTYSVSRVPKMSDVKRALRLAGLLVHEGTNKGADDETRLILTDKLKEWRDKCAKEDPEWQNLVREGGRIDVDVTMVTLGQMSSSGTKASQLTLTDENIDELFDACGRKLAPGEGLHRSYWKRFHDRENPNEAKLELYAVMRDGSVQAELESVAHTQFMSLWQKHKAEIRKLPAAERARFQLLEQASGKPVKLDWELPEKVVEKKDGIAWRHHLYRNSDGDFFAKLNTWEDEMLRAEMNKSDFVAWLRNLPRRDWALCIPYELAGSKPFYPDFVIIRKKGSEFEVDILEPHDDSRADTWAKAKGLAVFADDHGPSFGRLIIARKKNDKLQTADLNDKTTRAKARKMQSQSDLESLFV